MRFKSILNSMPRIDRALVLIGLAGFLMGVAGARMAHDLSWIRFFDCLHWTSACVAASVFAWHGVRLARERGDSTAPWWWFFVGLAAYTVAELIWDAQVYAGWSPFPGPADPFFLMLGPALAAGIYAYGRPHFDRTTWRIVLLDTGILLIAMLTATIALYLPRQSGHSWFQLCVMAAYPAGFWAAASLGLVLMLEMRARFDARASLLVAATMAHIALWNEWNLRLFADALIDGSLLNILFSPAVILLGMGAAVWRLEPVVDARRDRLCEALLRLLPLLLVTLAAAGIVLALLLPGVSGAAKSWAIAGGLLVVVLATIRQGLTLKDRDQLLAAQEETLRGRALLQTVIDTAPIRVFWKDRECRFLGCNAAFARDAGMNRPGDLLGKDDFQMAWRQEAALYQADDRAVMASGLPRLNYEEPQTTPDGRAIWLRTSKVPLRDDGGQVIGILGIYEDISERRQAEEELRESEQRFRTIFEQAGVGVSMCIASTGEFVKVNSKYCEIVGYTLEELQSMDFWTITHPDDRQLQNEMTADFLAGKLPEYTIEKRYIRKDSSIVWVSLTCSALWQPGEPPSCHIAVVQDISRRKRAEQELDQYRRNLEALVNERTRELMHANEMLDEAQHIAHLGSWEWNLASGALSWSREALNIYVPDDKEITPSYDVFMNAIHPDDQEKVEAAVNAALEQDLPFDIEHRVVSASKGVRVIHARGRVYRGHDGKPERMLGTVQDITCTKAIESMLIMSKNEAEQASQAKSRFLSSMSHELRTPLNAVIGFSELLATDATSTPDQVDQAGEILKAGKHLLQLVEEVLDLSMIEEGHSNIQLETVNLSALIPDALAMIQSMAKRQGIVLSLDIPAHVTYYARVSVTRTRQVLLNLVSNAIKYNKPHGKVTVAMDADDERVYLRVQDTGRGIPPERIPELFIPFARLGMEGSNIEGTGIGLVMARKLVELMGGEIGVQSVLGQGSTFWVALRREHDAPADRDTQPAQPEKADATYQRKVLCVEDNAANMKLMQGIIKYIGGWELLAASTAEAGLEIASAHQPDLILMDINLPGMDGYAALAKLRSTPETTAIPVFAVTASAMKEDVSRGKSAGFDGYITKPFKMEDIRAMLETASA